jgi:hypothetical protein
VAFQVHRAVADLASSGHEPQDQLVPPGAGHDRPLVGEDDVRVRLSGIPPKRVTSGFLPPACRAHRCRMTSLDTNSPIAPSTARWLQVFLTSECWARIW